MKLKDLRHKKLEEADIHELLAKKYSKNINEHHDENLSYGNKLADKVASFAGSWRFIIGFGVILVFWIVLNSILLFKKPFDPYPFILLNLVLSCIAAMQAPVIMMSQNRQEAKDRLRAENDYEINLKAELIIEDLHLRVDKLIENQEILLNSYAKLQSELEKLISSKS
jgi:uncharacterized membrane protein